MWHPTPNLTFAPVSYLPIFQKSWRHWQDTFHENDLWLADLQKGLNLVSDGDRTAFWGVVRSKLRLIRSWSDPGVGGPIRGPDPRSSFLSKFFKMYWIIRFKKKNWLTRGKYLIYCYDMVWQWFFFLFFIFIQGRICNSKKKCYFFHTFSTLFLPFTEIKTVDFRYH